ncbi:MAG: hypothetical protein RLZZ292_3100 [Bacteroidota bacterium]|jgi:hypothetical protein
MKKSQSFRRQAVVVIHGIGNQQPMDTLRGFVSRLLEPNDKMYSSPNRLTDNLELRKLSIGRKNTDFYEFYWANLVKDVPMTDILMWLIKLIYTRRLPERLKKVVWGLRISLPLLTFGIFLLGSRIALMFKNPDMFKVTVYGFLMVWILRSSSDVLFKLLENTFVQFIGDAVRYTVPTPENIETRSKIRQSGLELLRKLHEDTEEDDPTQYSYDRIVVVGHSLGGIIAYDILSFLWSANNKTFDKTTEVGLMNQTALADISNYVNSENFDVAEYQVLQHRLFKEQRQLGNTWRITDFITLGSPLAHGAFLLAKDNADFAMKIEQREVAVSPPQMHPEEKQFFYPKMYDTQVNTTDGQGITVVQKEKRTIKILHSAAQFGVVRWSNFYFNADYVGGSMRKWFGNGMVDKEIIPVGKTNQNIPVKPHTAYWSDEQPEPMNTIREILEL